MAVAEYVQIHPQSSASDTVALRHETILLVEDEDFVRDVTCEVLESAGYHVMTARNAAEAADIFEQYSRLIHLVITDRVMPGRDGRMLAQDLLARCPGLKVIVSSGYPEPLANSGSRDDSTFFLPKPFSLASLLATIARVLAECKADQVAVATFG